MSKHSDTVIVGESVNDNFGKNSLLRAKSVKTKKIFDFFRKLAT